MRYLRGSYNRLESELSRMILETNSLKVYEILVSSNSRNVGSSVISSIFVLISRSWEVRFAFVRREGNMLADAMSRLVRP
ncbi:hypothetical protein GQ457_01G005780 [Hibiscus cannabinus]